jgi:hypothetical protein
MPHIQLTHSMYIATRICRSYGALIAHLCFSINISLLTELMVDDPHTGNALFVA